MILALFTMTVGNVLALLQTNIRRLLAYSSIAHAGYMLIGISVGFWDILNPSQRVDPMFGFPGGVQSCLFYLIAYSVVTAGLFAVLVYLGQPGKQVEHVEDLTGLWRTQPVAAICAALFLFSLAGMPPLPGFWGKLSIFSGALSVRSDVSPLSLPNTWFVVLAIIGVLNSAIGAVYYLRIVGVMFLHEPLATPRPSGGRTGLATVAIAGVLTLALGLQAGPVFAYLRKIDVTGQLMQAQHVEQPASVPLASH
jgi:NADH-quinone oxidoreductase subunit N